MTARCHSRSAFLMGLWGARSHPLARISPRLRASAVNIFRPFSPHRHLSVLPASTQLGAAGGVAGKAAVKHSPASGNTTSALTAVLPTPYAPRFAVTETATSPGVFALLSVSLTVT